MSPPTTVAVSRYFFLGRWIIDRWIDELIDDEPANYRRSESLHVESHSYLTQRLSVAGKA